MAEANVPLGSDEIQARKKPTHRERLGRPNLLGALSAVPLAAAAPGGAIFEENREQVRQARAKFDELAMLLGIDEDPDLDRVQTLVRELRDDHRARCSEEV